jgi:multidrug efflux pump
VVEQVDRALVSLRGGGDLAAVEQRGAGRRPELHLEIDRARAADLGVSVQEIARVIALAHGEPAGAYLASGDQRLDVVVTVDGGAEHWSVLQVRGSGGTLVPLDRVVKVEQRLEPAEILHRDRRRIGVVWVQGKPGAPAASVRQLLTAALPGATIGPVDPRFIAAERW